MAKRGVDNVAAHVPQGAKEFLGNAKSKILDSDKLRSFTVFFGIGEGDASFSFPLNPTISCPRIKDNILFFYLNYILIAAVILVFSSFAILISPKTLVVVLGMLITWVVMIRATQDGPIKLGPIEISRKAASMIWLVICGVVAFFLLKSVFFVTVGSASILAILHAWTRDASKHMQTSLVNEEVKSEAFVEMSGTDPVV
eukprot:CAMPEP_0204616494 /NCGR_PEP_ID=MMETSP0717-20131115/3728_1 /ASSEMBLY_ACC=CAM_ASM_000666 /TAXON_ID=230516 /ORGANISM="Chaetoceros curvisetus" /LENGTH=198 /DNA_ID=CAMNT_0051629751 /DNA_START=13 /DNA_END=609 /DNA_ORIENTATION=+